MVKEAPEVSTQVYYYNTLTNESTWEKPVGYKGDSSKASAQPKPLATQIIKGTTWSEVVCEDGKKYFYNTSTLVSMTDFRGCSALSTLFYACCLEQI